MFWPFDEVILDVPTPSQFFTFFKPLDQYPTVDHNNFLDYFFVIKISNNNP
jgi:hypothetical protein